MPNNWYRPKIGALTVDRLVGWYRTGTSFRQDPDFDTKMSFQMPNKVMLEEIMFNSLLMSEYRTLQTLHAVQYDTTCNTIHAQLMRYTRTKLTMRSEKSNTRRHFEFYTPIDC